MPEPASPQRAGGTRGQNGSSARTGGGRKASTAARGRSKTSAAAKLGATPKTYVASVESPRTLPQDFAEGIRDLEKALGLPVWMLIQQKRTDTLDYSTLRLFLGAREELAADGRIALVIDSPGGLGDAAYQIARILQRDGGFMAVIPRYAKSAATLLSLGATEAIMGIDAEIGPLDAQLWDTERDEAGSALNEVHALDQLHTVALEHLDETMVAMLGATRKRMDILLPIASKFVADMMRPMLEKVDAVHYAKQSRILAVASEYAVRLLVHAGIPPRRAAEIADKLVKGYPEHGFVIDRSEADDLGLLRLIEASDDVMEAVGRVDRALWSNKFTAFGKLQEKP